MKNKTDGVFRLSDLLENVHDLIKADAPQQQIHSAYAELGRAFEVFGPNILTRLEYSSELLRRMSNVTPYQFMGQDSIFADDCPGCKTFISKAKEAMKKEF